MHLASEPRMDTFLRRYFERVSKVPTLSHAEEFALAKRWRQHGDEAARNRLVQSHLAFVIALARRYQRKGSSFADVIAEGNLGLLYAADKFEPEMGNRFATYAQYWVRVYASRCAIRAGSAVPAPRTAIAVRFEKERAQRVVGDGHAANELVATKLHCSLERVEGSLFLLQRRNVSLEALGADRQGAAEPLLFASGASPEQAAVDNCEIRLLKSAIEAALEKLDSRERLIAERRLMAEPEAVSTLEELGAEFGISRERVRQLEARLKQKLAADLRGLGDRSGAAGSKAAAA